MVVKGPCGGSQDTAGTLLQRDQAAVLGRFPAGLAKRPVAVAVPGPLGCRQAEFPSGALEARQVYLLALAVKTRAKGSLRVPRRVMPSPDSETWIWLVQKSSLLFDFPAVTLVQTLSASPLGHRVFL
ncbi:hypothetical protein MG293_002169 [Ovis ammon polii]|uniref:Uncharacterized protein n=1 Tax=Ovis ammon polii TaxID=230172 RepID=A0AAD4UR53_OVIAM|nr:hypothetical protein MG293_002169 [Ovis ammon polii]